MSELDKALLAAQKGCEGVKKDGVNSHGRFSYASIEEVVSTARETLHRSGILVHPLTQRLLGDGSHIEQVFEVVHIPSGESKTITRTMVYPELKGVSPCQAQGIAESYLLKNTLRELLLLPRFDAKEDIDSYDNREASSYRSRTAGNPGARRN